MSWIKNTEFVLQQMGSTGNRVRKSIMEEQSWIRTRYARKDVWALDTPSFKQVGMITHFAKLHNQIHKIRCGMLGQLRVCGAGRF